MKFKQGNILEYYETPEDYLIKTIKNPDLNLRPKYLVIPTNLGFRKDKTNIMGAGLALTMAKKISLLEKIYGGFCYNRHIKKLDDTLCILEYYHLIMFAVKALNKDIPHLSFKNNADLATIDKSCTELKAWDKFNEVNIYMPLVGTGNGKLPVKDVLNVLRHNFKDCENIYIVDFKNYK